MKIEKLTLTNFRSASDISLEFNDKLNLFVGINGAGKSTILDALSISLSWLTKRIERPNGRGFQIADTDITAQASYSSIAIECKSDDTYRWQICKSATGNCACEIKSSLKQAYSLAEKVQQSESWPVVVYYPVSRCAAVPKHISTKSKESDIYDGSLTSKVDYEALFEWMQRRDNIQNQKLAEAIKKHKGDIAKLDIQQDQSLEMVKQVVEKFMPDITGIRIEREPQATLVLEKNGKSLSFEQLSDGEKNIIALVGDIARRLAMCNQKSKNPLDGEGIILIDEIALHLHPGWQRIVIPRLLDTFPNCQFFISTHSPQVISHVKPEKIFLLEFEGNTMTCSNVTESFGKNTDRILEDLMGVSARPSEQKLKLREIYQLISDGNLKEAMDECEALRCVIGEDPELVKADVLIKRKESIGR